MSQIRRITQRRPVLAPVRRSLRILLAEDDKALRTLLAAMLLRDGHAVWQAESGTELIRSLSSIAQAGVFVPDVIITDVRMPGPSGLDVLLALRRARWATPVVLMSAFVDDTVKRTAEALRAYRVFDKPFEPAQLLLAVQELSALPS